MLRFVSCILGLGLLLATAPLVRAQSGEASPALTTVAQVKKALATGGSEGRKLRVTGVVTYVDPYEGMFGLWDETGSILIRTVPQSVESGTSTIHSGQRVKAQGVLRAAEEGVDSLQVQELGDGSLPEPQRYSLVEIETRAPTGQWIEGSGVVRRATYRAPYLVLIPITYDDSTLVASSR